ncbi:hypothetical protein QVD17_17024 [Tagetes erecta]|uniref:SANT domain-containing protein n=1 Tax=Tagetes erecta TaxID=13708 RepID=A0AAD8KRJ5_TARER|nr:hypothetical protein QVD17_17024 [Tagetes erecta]
MATTVVVVVTGYGVSTKQVVVIGGGNGDRYMGQSSQLNSTQLFLLFQIPDTLISSIANSSTTLLATTKMVKDIDDGDKRVEWLQSEHYSAGGSIFGEPQKTTRVGDEYQAKIPSLMTKDERFQLIKSPACDDAKIGDRKKFEFGLSIPVTWVHNRRKSNEETAKGKSSNASCGTENDLVPVPCSSSEESWSVIEHDSFILGLYIFGKNLRVVNEFMGNKGMSNVISYYYGSFYRSNEYQKWSMYKKKRIRYKSIPGKKIFKGWRLHELLSRLLSNVTDNCKASLTQVIRMFEEGKLSFVKYVFTLRDIMGVDLLVQAVAIGKGKQDLTSKTKTRLRSKKVESTCSSLKTEEIVNILKDRIGLSKARLNEFFWTAVWPRLLARGWHSEQPRNYAVQNSKNFVFLAPGVTKFSRRSLVKGSQYFDSLTEVLNKVASDPHLLENEPEKDRLIEPCETQGSDDEQDLMKCTVVDTSMRGLVKFKELTSLTFFEPVAETEHDTKRQRVNNIKNHNTSGEDEAMEDSVCCDKKRTRIVIDLNSPRVGPGSDDSNKLSAAKKPVLSVKTTNQTDVLTTLANGQRQCRRNRALTPKALEALANGFMNPKKKRGGGGGGPEDGTRRRVRAKTASVSSCGARYLVDGVFDGSSSHMVTQSPK